MLGSWSEYTEENYYFYVDFISSQWVHPLTGLGPKHIKLIANAMKQIPAKLNIFLQEAEIVGHFYCKNNKYNLSWEDTLTWLHAGNTRFIFVCLYFFHLYRWKYCVCPLTPHIDSSSLLVLNIFLTLTCCSYRKNREDVYGHHLRWCAWF